MLLTERETPKGLLVSVCDADCVGKSYETGDLTLDVTEDFYASENAVDADDEEVVASLRRATVANIVGERAVALAIDADLVDEDRVLEFDGTRHAQLLWM